MKTYTYQESINKLDTLLKRDEGENQEIRRRVLEIIDTVKSQGDAALINYTEKFDGCRLDTLRVTDAEIQEAFDLVGREMAAVIEEAAGNIRAFHEKQK